MIFCVCFKFFDSCADSTLPTLCTISSFGSCENSISKFKKKNSSCELCVALNCYFGKFLIPFHCVCFALALCVCVCVFVVLVVLLRLNCSRFSPMQWQCYPPYSIFTSNQPKLNQTKKNSKRWRNVEKLRNSIRNEDGKG